MLRFGMQISVRRGNHANIDGDWARPANSLEFAFLQHAQELGLEINPHLGDFVEQQRSAVRALERALGPPRMAPVNAHPSCPNSALSINPWEARHNSA